MRTIQREIVAGLIQTKDGKFLFGKKDQKGGGVYADCWHTPGGGVEERETLGEALHREMLEETGVDISGFPIELLDDSDSATAERTEKDSGERVLVEMHFHVYKISILNKTSDEIVVKPNDDLVELGWIGKEDLMNMKLTPPSEKLFKKLGYIKS